MATKVKTSKKIAKSAAGVHAVNRLLPKGKTYGLPDWALRAGRKALSKFPHAVGLVYDTSCIFVIDKSNKRHEIFCTPVADGGEIIIVENFTAHSPTFDDAIEYALGNSDFSRELIREGSLADVGLPSIVITEGFAFQGNVVSSAA